MSSEAGQSLPDPEGVLSVFGAQTACAKVNTPTESHYVGKQGATGGLSRGSARHRGFKE